MVRGDHATFPPPETTSQQQNQVPHKLCQPPPIEVLVCLTGIRAAAP